MAQGRPLGTAILLGIAGAILLWPAIWNGFPIVFPDTGGYLARPFDGTLEMGRAAFYGAFLALGTRLAFWPNVIAQAVLTVWIVAVTLRTHGIAPRPRNLVVAAAALGALTGLPWYVSQLMPDILAPCAVLSLYLLAFRNESLSRMEVALLIGVTAVAIASHMATLALLLCLAAVAAIWRAFSASVRPRLVTPVAALACGVMLSLGSNLLLTGQFTFTPGGTNFIFGRLVQDGIVADYLDQRCPDERLRLCEHREEIAGWSADDWLWNDPSPFYKLGGHEGFSGEARAIIVNSLLEFPQRHLIAAGAAAWDQLLQAATGEGLTSWNPHTEWIFSLYAPAAREAYENSRQARTQWDFSGLNAIQVPLAFAAFALVPLAIVFRKRLGIERAPANLLGFVALALIFNAAICGILSNPHDRYQSRLVWLVPFGLAIAMGTRTPRSLGG